ncbi:MAG TPA: hypothetical protein VEC99_01545, partial [Clostridia bacterium]|nr:hypothetical protein [Clostridia bacterium]
PWIVPIAFKKGYVELTSALLPWYASAMVPLALANVLLNNLLAKPDANKAPAICVFVLALGYIIILTQFHPTPVSVLRTVGACNLLLLAICAWFTWRGAKKGAISQQPSLA